MAELECACCGKLADVKNLFEITEFSGELESITEFVLCRYCYKFKFVPLKRNLIRRV